jgi:hypothetical protein
MISPTGAILTLEADVAFALDEVGIERGATQVLFDAPPIIEQRHAEGGPSRTYELSITNEPCVVEYAVNRDQAKLLIRMEQLSASQVATIETLLGAGGLVTVKLKPGVSTTNTCAFGPRIEHRFEPYNGPYPESDKTGGALTSVLTTYRVTLSLLRLD